MGSQNRYDQCLQLVRRTPEKGLAVADAWANNGGGPAAVHCSALALIALERYAEAARSLDRIGHEKLATVAERAELFDQAGNAWLLARRGGEAFASFSSALALSPGDPDLCADRARASALLGDWKAADADLSSALKTDRNRADLLVLRASARHAQGQRGGASADLEAALKIVPNYPEALLERATLKFDSGDVKGAQRDWLAVIKYGPATQSAAVAQQRISALGKVQTR